MTRPSEERGGEDPAEFGDGELGPAFDSPSSDTLAAVGAIIMRASSSTTLDERARMYANAREILSMRYAAALDCARGRLSEETPHLPPIEMDDELYQALWRD